MTVASLPQSRPRAAAARTFARREGAFTLVEVTLAIGIVAFAFVAIFALLPVGMTNFRRSLDTAITTEISQRLINEVKESEFATVALLNPYDKSQNPNPAKRYFTDQGDEVDLNATPNASWLYSAEVTVGTPASTALPGAITPASKSLLTVMIRVGPNPKHVLTSPFGSPDQETSVSKSADIVPHRTFIALVAKNQ